MEKEGQRAQAGAELAGLPQGLTLSAHIGDAIGGALDALARLRIKVFRDWPYLYEGSLDYEREYLETYARCPEAAIFIVRDGGEAVGASTCLPMAAAEADVREAFQRAGLSPAHWFYFGESVLLSPYRGLGLGVQFFALREAHALRFAGINGCGFCAVERPMDHPARPAGGGDLREFWRHRGYAPKPGLVAEFSWQDLGESIETVKPMQFWIKRLREGEL